MRLKESESSIQKAILQWGEYQEGIQMFRMNVIGTPLPDGGFRPSPQRGVADLYVQLMVLGIPVGVWLEVKSKTGRLSKHQKDFGKLVPLYYVCRSIDDAAHAIEDARNRICGKINSWKHESDMRLALEMVSEKMFPKKREE
jgi:hypothetical protein